MAFYGFVAAKQSARLKEQIAEASNVSAELAERFFDAGNISARELALARAEASEARIDHLEAAANAYGRPI